MTTTLKNQAHHPKSSVDVSYDVVIVGGWGRRHFHRSKPFVAPIKSEYRNSRPRRRTLLPTWLDNGWWRHFFPQIHHSHHVISDSIRC